MAGYLSRILEFVPADAAEVEDAFKLDDGSVNYAAAFGRLSSFYDVVHMHLADAVTRLELVEAKLREPSCTTTTTETDATVAAGSPSGS